MKLFKIPKAHQTNEEMELASRRFSVLLTSKSSFERGIYGENIEGYLDGFSFSDCFEMYIRCIFSRIFQDPVASRDLFLNAIANVRLNKLSVEYNEIMLRVRSLLAPTPGFLKDTVWGLMTNTSKKNIIEKWKKIHDQPEGERLAKLLLLSKIVLSMERMGYLFLEEKQRAAKKIGQDIFPAELITEILPILLVLQSIAPDDEENVVISKLDHAIKETMKLVHFPEDDPIMVQLIRDDLFEQHYLGFVDVEPDEDDALFQLRTLFL